MVNRICSIHSYSNAEWNEMHGYTPDGTKAKTRFVWETSGFAVPPDRDEVVRAVTLWINVREGPDLEPSSALPAHLKLQGGKYVLTILNDGGTPPASRVQPDHKCAIPVADSTTDYKVVIQLAMVKFMLNWRSHDQSD